jgi:hypothetical protein
LVATIVVFLLFRFFISDLHEERGGAPICGHAIRAQAGVSRRAAKSKDERYRNAKAADFGKVQHEVLRRINAFLTLARIEAH